ncbi:unnamed protein product [Hydatigera taeniaeformis]|uniref:OCRE domain-containing protein n=1 Tax=Hydatigena taeniaeformis TaxID=6205 RepID=A0A0R3WI90_HYDTA|nr:unnamed protein product [Hydatigera taeniaeformis]
MSQNRRRPLPREPNDEEKNVIVAVRHCARELDDMLQGARRKAQVDAKLFATKTAVSLFRGVEFYADMYSKLKIKSRMALTRFFQRSRDLDDMVDTQEAIDETEECWKSFLMNIDNDMKGDISKQPPSYPVKGIGDYIELLEPRLIDCSSFEECNLQQTLSEYTSSLLIFQPAYLPDISVRCRFSEISKVVADFYQLNVGFVVITWGPESAVRAWSKHLLKHLKWPVLWDCENFFTSFLSFKRGCAALWASQMLDFCAYQSITYKRSIQPLPIDIDWSTWNWVGGEVVIASPAVSRMLYKRELEARTRTSSEEKADVSPLPKRPDTGSSSRICFIHRADNVADMALPGSIYQAALVCFATSQNKSESDVVEEIRTHRRLATPPESGRLQYEDATGLYYDPETELHYDSRTGYFYDAVRRTYYYWSAESHRYVPANELVRAQQAEAHKLRLEAAQQAALRAVREQEAARAAGARVAAQLAALRAEKDEYASYAYATCLFEPADDPIAAVHSSSSAGIQESLRLLGGSISTTTASAAAAPGTSLTNHESSLYPPGCPPPPGT